MLILPYEAHRVALVSNKPAPFQTQNLYSCVCCCHFYVQDFFFFCWVLKILNRRHCNSSTTHHKCFFPVDLVSHAAIAKKTVVLKKSQGRWRWLCWLLWHGLSLTETCSSTGSGSTDQGETEEFTDDNFCRKFSLSTADELPHPGSATWPGWEGQQVWQSSYIPRHV